MSELDELIEFYECEQQCEVDAHNGSYVRASRLIALLHALRELKQRRAAEQAANPKGHRCKGMAEYQRWERVENSWWFITEEEKFRQALVIGASYCHLCGEKLGD